MSKLKSSASLDGVNYVSFELLLSTVIYLMTRYVNAPCGALQKAICMHLGNLQETVPSGANVLKRNLAQIHRQWEAMDCSWNREAYGKVKKWLPPFTSNATDK